MSGAIGEIGEKKENDQWAQLKEQLPLRSLSEHEGSYREREEPPMRSADEE